MSADATHVLWAVGLPVGLVLGLLFTRAARAAAPRLGLVDRPDGRRKLQTRAVPVAGGVAVFAAALGALLVAAVVSPAVAAALTESGPRAAALLAAAVLLVAVGVADDRYNLRARFKLLGQVAAAAILIGPGELLIGRVGLLGWEVDLGPAAVPVTLFWLLLCVNALNLIDGMDGFLGTVAVTALLTVAAVAGMTGHLFAAAVAVALAGAVAGFLWFNLPPATIYMGDAGSMLVGLVVGALAVVASVKGPATVALGAPVAILILPMMDTTAAVIRRRLTGRGLATTDRGHLHHVLLKHGLTTRRVLVLVAALGLTASAGALATVALRNDLFALVAAAGVVLTLVTTRLFGYAEFRLVVERVRAAARALRGGQPAWGLAVRLHGTADWARLWDDLIDRAGPLGLQAVWLDVNAPALHEDYHARWDRAAGGAVPDTHLWRLEIPLFGHGQPIGRLAVVGGRDHGPVTETLAALSRLITAAEVHAREMTAPARPAAASADTVVMTPVPLAGADTVVLDPAAAALTPAGS